MKASHQRRQRRRELVLVGGGHTHVQVLRALTMRPLPDIQLTVVLDRPIAIYSGMVPGFVAGQYKADELEIDVVPLARRAQARVILDPAVGIDAAAQYLELESRPPVPYDLLSFDIGSTVAALDLEGVREHAIPSRPIGQLVARVEEVVASARASQGGAPFRALVVGGGAGGVELAFTLEARLASIPSREVQLTLLEGGERILARYPERLIQRVERAAQSRGIQIRCRQRVRRVCPDAVELEDGRQQPFDALIWVTGAVGHPLLRDAELPTDDRGFVWVRNTLQVEGQDNVFAVGDCATLTDYPDTAKAGVYAVRQGPYLTANLRAFVEGRSLRSYRPQRDFLTLLNLGNGSAIGGKWGLSLEGGLIWKLKDRIDRRFMRRFQVLEPGGGLTPTFAALPAMEPEAEMLCGGCAAKVAPAALAQALDRLRASRPETGDPDVLLGFGSADDAAAYRTAGGDLVVSSLDAFRAFTDDPYLVGQVAAVNAASDVQAKGIRPRFALALVAVPQELDPEQAAETLFQVLAGARETFDSLGVSLLGGHSISGPELLVGFSVDGLASAELPLLRLSTARPAQALVLTKALGTGVVLRADMQGLARGPWLQATLASMLQSNGDAAELARLHGATAVTDVTGFGLAGHLRAMLERSGISAEIELASLPSLPGAEELLNAGLRSTYHGQNAGAESHAGGEAAGPRCELLYDPQTSGGLLVALEPGAADELVDALREVGYWQARIVGRTRPRAGERSVLTVIP